MYIKKSLFRSNSPDVFLKEDAPRDKVNPQENTNTEVPSPEDLTTSGVLILHVTRILKELNYETFSFTVVKRNLLAIKMEE